ncbi:hypothetical protein APR41_18480 [Salegentibacter salinarum]|uniref:Uncharacterized protein n=1 Tax=Salegentibacter salinarum TaxID=447422 RepID=A0A2N0TSU2_9FLAO|nr:hypothetical protein APR41_18480 [Salegentibacter salinarum]
MSRGSLHSKITAIYLAFTIERLKIMENFFKPLVLLFAANNSALKALFTYLYTNNSKRILQLIIVDLPD